MKFQSLKTENIITSSATKSTYHIQTTGSDNEQTWFDLLKSQELINPIAATAKGELFSS